MTSTMVINIFVFLSKISYNFVKLEEFLVGKDLQVMSTEFNQASLLDGKMLIGKGLFCDKSLSMFNISARI